MQGFMARFLPGTALSERGGWQLARVRVMVKIMMMMVTMFLVASTTMMLVMVVITLMVMTAMMKIMIIVETMVMVDEISVWSVSPLK